MCAQGCVAAFLACASSIGVVAQTTVSPPVAQPPNETERALASDKRHCFGGFSGINYGAPLKLGISGAAGLRKESTHGGDYCAYVSPKIGMGGALISLGIAHNAGTLGGGYAVSGGFLRTFGAPSMARRMSNYAGASVHVFPALGVGVELGAYRRIGNSEIRARKNIIAWAVGLGL